MTKVVLNEHNTKCTYDSLSKGDFFRYGVANMLFIKTDTVRGVKDDKWNAVCVDPSGIVGWHSSFSPEDLVLHVPEVTISI